MVLGPFFAAKNGPRTKLALQNLVHVERFWLACLLIGLPIILWTESCQHCI